MLGPDMGQTSWGACWALSNVMEPLALCFSVQSAHQMPPGQHLPPTCYIPPAHATHQPIRPTSELPRPSTQLRACTQAALHPAISLPSEAVAAVS